MKFKSTWTQDGTSLIESTCFDLSFTLAGPHYYSGLLAVSIGALKRTQPAKVDECSGRRGRTDTIEVWWSHTQYKNNEFCDI